MSHAAAPSHVTADSSASPSNLSIICCADQYAKKETYSHHHRGPSNIYRFASIGEESRSIFYNSWALMRTDPMI